MKLTVLFDDTQEASAALRDLMGVRKFGALVFQRRSRVQAMAAVAAEAGAGFFHAQSSEDLAQLLENMRNESDDCAYLIVPAHLAAATPDGKLVTFLRQLAFSPNNLQIPVRDNSTDTRGWTLMRASMTRQYLAMAIKGQAREFFEQHLDILSPIRGRVPLVDISDERALLDFLSGQMDARYFNALERDDYTVTKRSADRAKLKREYDFYHLSPPEMQMFLVQPFDFQDDGRTASYRMERLSVPDMSLQWVHGAFQEAEFERFLDHILFFIRSRPERALPATDVRRVQHEIYIAKVEQRLSALKQAPDYAQLAPLLERVSGGIDALQKRYLALYEKIGKRLPHHRLTFGHGDPCFSNILYSKTNQYLKLIDPRGATTADDLFTDPYYDVAKLSHSVLGGYDFINQGKFDIQVDDALRPTLTLENPPADWARRLFLEKLDAAGFDAELVRLCEASLFISMLPLHMDRPRKVLAFAIRGVSILDELSGRDQ
jgi:hypothetical protein